MKQKEVHSIPFIVNPQPALPGDKREIVAELEKELLEMMHQSTFQVGLGVFILQSEEFEHQRVFDFFVCGKRVARVGQWLPPEAFSVCFSRRAVRS